MGLAEGVGTLKSNGVSAGPGPGRGARAGGLSPSDSGRGPAPWGWGAAGRGSPALARTDNPDMVGKVPRPGRGLLPGRLEEKSVALETVKATGPIRDVGWKLPEDTL